MSGCRGQFCTLEITRPMKITDELIAEYVRTFGGIMHLDSDEPAPRPGRARVQLALGA